MAAWSSPGALGALPTTPKVGYAVAALALFATYKKMVPVWAGLAAAGAAYWFLIRGAGMAGAQIIAGNVIVSDGTSYVLTAASPGVLSPDGATLTLAGSAYPVLSTGPASDGSNNLTYYVDPPNTTS
jgi:hypothetical protein